MWHVQIRLLKFLSVPVSLGWRNYVNSNGRSGEVLGWKGEDRGREKVGVVLGSSSLYQDSIPSFPGHPIPFLAPRSAVWLA